MHLPFGLGLLDGRFIQTLLIFLPFQKRKATGVHHRAFTLIRRHGCQGEYVQRFGIAFVHRHFELALSHRRRGSQGIDEGQFERGLNGLRNSGAILTQNAGQNIRRHGRRSLIIKRHGRTKDRGLGFIVNHHGSEASLLINDGV